MTSLERICSQVLKIVQDLDHDCVRLSQVLHNMLRCEVDDHYLDAVALALYRSGKVKIYFSTRDCDYYICKSTCTEQTSSKLTMQKIVDLLRSKFDGELVPKPHVLDFLKELIPEKYSQIYNILTRDGVLEEVNVSGMMFVKITR